MSSPLPERLPRQPLGIRVERGHKGVDSMRHRLNPDDGPSCRLVDFPAVVSVSDQRPPCRWKRSRHRHVEWLATRLTAVRLDIVRYGPSPPACRDTLGPREPGCIHREALVVDTRGWWYTLAGRVELCNARPVCGDPGSSPGYSYMKPGSTEISMVRIQPIAATTPCAVWRVVKHHASRRPFFQRGSQSVC